MADSDVTLGIEIETTQAEKSLSTLEKKSIESAERMQKAFDGLKTVAAAAIAAFAGKQVIDFFAEGIKSAVAQEQAFARLGAQMEATGEKTDEAMKAFGDLADELENTTKFGDDAVVSAAALAKSYGLTNDQALKLTRAAADLASATGDTLDGAVEQLTASYSGNIKTLGKLVPEVKGLTKEQLAAGAAVDLLAKRFGGAAAKEVQTFQGAITRANNAFDNFRESFGTLITSNKTIIAAIGGIGKLFQSLQEIVEKNQEAFTNFINFGVRALVVSLSVAVSVINSVVSALGVAAATTADFAAIFMPEEMANRAREFGDSIVNATADMSAAMTDVNDAVDNFAVGVFEAGEKAEVSAKKAEKSQAKYTREVVKSAEEVGKLTEESKKFLDSLTTGAASEFDRVEMEARRAFAEIDRLRSKSAKDGGLSEAEAREASFKITQIQIKKTNELIDKSYKETVEKAKQAAADARSAVEAAASDPIKFAVAKFEIPPLPITLETAQIAGAGAGLLGKMLEGAAGAKALISSGAAAIGDALIPGIGGAVGGIVSKLAEGPEATKKFIKEFIAAIPQIMEAIAESIPVVVEVLVDTLVNEGGAVRIGVAIARAMSGEAILKNIGRQIGVSFGSSMNAEVLGGKIASGFVTVGDKLTATFTNIGSLLYNSIFHGFINGGQQIVQFIATAVSQLPTAFASLGTALVTPVKNFFTVDMATLISRAFLNAVSVFDPIINFFKSFKIEIPGVSGGGGPKLPKIPNLFNHGGVVYAADGFKPRGTDTVPAMLTPGEMVLNRGQQAELFNLANGGGGSGAQVAMLQQIIDLLSQPQTTEVTAAVNGKAIADIVLQQSRQRARLTA